MDELMIDFLKDTEEDLIKIENSLVQLEEKLLENKNIDYGLVNNIFRYFHSIKGSAGFFKLKVIVKVAHEAENILDLFRKKNMDITVDSLSTIFKAHDFLEKLVFAIKESGSDEGLDAESSTIILELQNFISGSEKKEQSELKNNKFGIFTDQVESKSELDDIKSNNEEKNKFGLFGNDNLTVEPIIENAVDGKDGNEVSENVAKMTDIRISTDRLDALMNLLGELVIVEAMVSRYSNDEILNIEMLRRSTSQLSNITRDLQEIGLSMRLVPLAGLFHKMNRLVRDVAKKSKKNVTLEISGEGTEIDKSIIEQLSAPLVHILRNAVDHGIEIEKNRIQNNKNPKGKIQLQARHKGSEIWIIISDDGQGLNRDQIIRKAIDENVIEEGISSELSDEEVWDLIFVPGISTAEKVTDISGRGVGMDVVKKEIQKIKGRIEIQSKFGYGTSFILRIPLTLAIIDSMVVKYNERFYIIPTSHIERFIDLRSVKVSDIHDNQRVLQLNGMLISVVELTDIFSYETKTKSKEDRIAVIVGKRGKFVALKLDEIIGSQQIVVKPLDESMETLHGLSGSGILGDGEVGMILDSEYIVKKYMVYDENIQMED